jgi:hypothetical protein
VFAEYVLDAAGRTPTEWNQRGIAIGVVTGASICMSRMCLAQILLWLNTHVQGCALSTKWSLRLVNFLSIIKVITLLFLVVTGFVVCVHYGVAHPDWHGANSDAGSEGTRVLRQVFRSTREESWLA